MGALMKLILLGFLAAFAAAAAASEPAAQAPKHVLVLFDDDKDSFPGLAAIDRRIRESFKTELGQAAEIHAESMALSRSGPGASDAKVVDYFRSKYASWKPDLVIAVQEPPLDFMLRNGEALFPGVPVVFCVVDAATVENKKLPPNFKGVLLKRTYSPTLEAALRLQPATRNVFVVGGTAPRDRYLQAFVRRDLQPFEGRVAINYLFDMNMDDLLARLSRLPPQSVILYVTVFADGAGTHFVPHEVLSSIAATANAPVYVFVDQYVGLGAVGGNVYSTEAHGTDVARLGQQILRGTPTGSLPVREPVAQAVLFDARQLKRWNLNTARLPPGSVILFQEPSAWELYGGYIATILVVLLTQAALIAVLLVARARQRRVLAVARARAT